MPSRRRFLAAAVATSGVSLFRLPPAYAAPADDGEESLAGWAPDGLVTRADWKADESLRTWEAEFSPVQVVTVHHSARPVGADGAAEVREIYDLHARRLGWGDVGYHLLIDPDGVLYEGRHAGGEDGDHVPVFGTGGGGEDGEEDEDDGDRPKGARPLVVTGGHVRGHNPGNVGVCLLGDFTRARPTGAALDTLERTLADLCRFCGLDPLGTVRYANPDTGETRTARVISGHRDWKATSCPGATVAGALEATRERVAKLLW